MSIITTPPKEKAIYFDLDGTCAGLYGVENWLEKLQSSDPSPYIEAKPLIDMRVLARYLNVLQRVFGYKLGAVSWLSKDSTPLYDEAVRNRKRKWLQEHLGSVHFDEMHLVKYGTPKHLIVHQKSGILFDDNYEVREKWYGDAYDETNIIGILKGLILCY